MPKWIENQRNYEFSIIKDVAVTKIHVAGVKDDAGRKKLILMDRADNTGLSVLDERAAARCIEGICALGKFEPQSAEWFARGRNGKMYGIDIQTEQITYEHPEVTAIRKDDDRADIAAAKKLYPDITREKVKEAAVGDISPKKEDALLQAFGQARAVEVEKTLDDAPQNQEAHDHDLSQEEF